MITAEVTFVQPTVAVVTQRYSRSLTPTGMFTFAGEPLLTFRNSQITFLT
jgi:hypothetical protein